MLYIRGKHSGISTSDTSLQSWACCKRTNDSGTFKQQCL